MPRFLVTWKANDSAWPGDPKQILAILEGSIGGGTHLRDSGAARDIGMFTPQEGFAIFEADSKAALLGMLNPFYPFYSQTVQEIVEWDAGAKALIESAKQAASR